MKVTIKQLLILGCALLLSGSCSSSRKIVYTSDDESYYRRNDNSDEDKEDRYYDLCNQLFDAINFNGVANINLVQTNGSAYVKLYGPHKMVSRTHIKVSGNTLYITQDEIKSHTYGLTIAIGTPSLRRIATSGVGNTYAGSFRVDELEVENTGVGNINISQITGNELKLLSKGVGNMDIKVVVNSIIARNLGVGSITIAGSSKVANLTNNGTGSLNACWLKAHEVNAVCNGVGNLNCYASKILNAELHGIGNIEYAGDPQERNFNQSGSTGKIKRM